MDRLLEEVAREKEILKVDCDMDSEDSTSLYGEREELCYRERKRRELSPRSREELRLSINSRERQRMHDINSAMDALRQVMPYGNGPNVKKISKMNTLLLARNYILLLTRSIDEMKRFLATTGHQPGTPGIQQQTRGQVSRLPIPPPAVVDPRLLYISRGGIPDVHSQATFHAEAGLAQHVTTSPFPGCHHQHQMAQLSGGLGLGSGSPGLQHDCVYCKTLSETGL